MSIVIFIKEASAAAITETALIRQDCTGYDNCYTSLADWEADYGGIIFSACSRGDLVCANKIAIAKIDGTWIDADTAALTIDGWNTGPSNYIRIYTTAAARQTGTAGTGYRLEVGIGVEAVLDLREPYVRVEGLEIYSTSQTGGQVIYIRPATSGDFGEVHISHSLIHGDGANTRSGIYNYDLAGTFKVWNNIIYDVAKEASDAGIKIAQGTDYLHNNTVVDTIAGYGILSVSGTVIAKNNLVRAANNCFYGVFQSSTTASKDSNYNASSDNTTTGGVNDKRNQIYTFVDEPNNNFHLAGADTAAKDAGRGLAGDKYLPFTDDLDGETRGGAWDIGADEYTGTIPSYCGDGVCNGNEGSSTCLLDCPPQDSTPPVCSDASPAGSLEAGTKKTRISLTTDESATCKYSVISGLDYDFMTGGMLASETGTSHSADITGLFSGNTYTYYIKCQDEAGKANTDDFVITFSVAPTSVEPELPLTPAPTPKPLTPEPAPVVSKKPVFAYGRPRVSSLAEEQQKALELKALLEQHYGKGKIPVARKHWPTIVNSYVYGGYPIKAITQAIKFGGKTVHPTIPYEVWKTAEDYWGYIDK